MSGLTHPPYTKFKAWMEENKVTNIELADLLNVTKSVITKRLNGTGADFSVSEVRTICMRYGISADVFFVDYRVS